MKSARIFLLPTLALILLTLGFPLSGHGQFLIGELLKGLSDARKNVERYNQNIKLSEATVNSIIEDDETGIVRPDGGPTGRTANERIRDLKDGIAGELAKAKSNELAYTVATQQLGAALDRYNKNRTPENLKNAQGIANQVTTIRNSLDGNFAIIKNMIRQITMIRKATAGKEWENPDGRFKGERQALDNLWNLLSGTITPFTVKLQEGTWQETNLDTKKTRTIRLFSDGQVMKATIGKRTYVAQAGTDPTILTFTCVIKTPEDVTVIEGPIPRQVLLSAIKDKPLTFVYWMERRSPTFLVGTVKGGFFIQWDAKTMEVKTLKNDPNERVEWRAVGK